MVERERSDFLASNVLFEAMYGLLSVSDAKGSSTAILSKDGRRGVEPGGSGIISKPLSQMRSNTPLVQFWFSVGLEVSLEAY